MQSLSPEKILVVWEAGRQQHDLDRALTLLAAASQELSRDELADLTIGERDERLLQLRTLMLGPSAMGFAECAQCAERIEFPVETAKLLEGRAPARPTDVADHEVETNGSRVRFRLPTSRDLARAVTVPDSSEGLRRLVESCVFAPNDSNLPNDILEAVGCAMIEADPQAEITLRLLCPACAYEWDLLFDIAEFFWTEISVQAQRLLREIDALARAYGWTEREILSLPAQRRKTYLELLAA